VKVERQVINWLAELFHLPECFHPKAGGHGLIYHTAGEGMFHAAFAAKNQKRMNTDESLVDRNVGYCTTISNIAVEKVLMSAGLVVHKIEQEVHGNMADEYPITFEYYDDIFIKDEEQGLVPTVIVVTLGSTATLCIESLGEIHRACKKHSVWMHVDAAHLGVYGALEEYRWIFNNLELADSVNINGSKSLGVGNGNGFFWTKHSEEVFNSFISGPDPDRKIINRCHLTSPTGPRAIRCWISLKSLGSETIKSHL
jgi:aromatic-L-amino-acid decarboxylase